MSYSWSVTPWIEEVEEVDHSSSAESHLLHWAKKPRFISFLRAFTDEIDSIESMLVDLVAKRSVYTAEGEQQDLIGRIVIQNRGNLSDSAYFFFLIGKIFVNTHDWQPEQIIDLVVNYLNSNTCEIDEFFPATCRVFADNVQYEDPVFRLLDLFSGAGIKLEFTYSSLAESEVFQTSSTLGSDESSSAKGTSNLAQTNGGKLAGSIQS